MLGKLGEFLESRAGLVTEWRRFADEPVPRRRAWLFTLGSAALVAFLVQLGTGVVLAMYYAPTPDHAHQSVKAIQTVLPGGSLVRGLHHWGASAMVLLAALHLLRTFFSGSYRKPRELNWIVGVALLLLILGFGFTGYLLPWDQKAYWATVVGTKAPAGAPVVGPLVGQLLAGGPGVGAYTLTRFYTVHVVLLPLATLALIALHLVLLRRHGHSGPTTGPDPREPFFPYQLARDGVAGLLVVGALVYLALAHPAPLERVADPSDTSYVPRPEWYFLPLFQLLKLFKGPWEPVGTALLPGLAVLLLALVPWLDRAKERRPRARKGLLAAGSAAAAATLVLLVLGALDAPRRRPPSALDTEGPPPPDPALLYGAEVYAERGCASCHGPLGAGVVGSPEGTFALVGRTRGLDPAAVEAHVKEKATPPKASPDGEPGDPEKGIPALLAFTARLPEGPLDLSKVPATVRLGGAVVAREDCRDCHDVYGTGGHRGPALAGVAGRRSKEWLVEHFKDPKKLVPGSRMPAFRDLPENELAAMSDYLLALP